MSGGGGISKTLNVDNSDLKLYYVNTCSVLPEGYPVVVQGSSEVPALSELFYTLLTVNVRANLKGMVHSGSMAISEGAECSLGEAKIVVEGQQTESSWLAVVESRPSQNAFMICLSAAMG